MLLRYHLLSCSSLLLLRACKNHQTRGPNDATENVPACMAFPSVIFTGDLSFCVGGELMAALKRHPREGEFTGARMDLSARVKGTGHLTRCV